jgi:hypothetical protein
MSSPWAPGGFSTYHVHVAPFQPRSEYWLTNTLRNTGGRRRGEEAECMIPPNYRALYNSLPCCLPWLAEQPWLPSHRQILYNRQARCLGNGRGNANDTAGSRLSTSLWSSCMASQRGQYGSRVQLAFYLPAWRVPG